MSASVYDPAVFQATVLERLDAWSISADKRRVCQRLLRELAAALAECAGATLQERWEYFEANVWPRWVETRTGARSDLWRWGVLAAIMTRTVRPGWPITSACRVTQWAEHLPADDPLVVARDEVDKQASAISWVEPRLRGLTVLLALRAMLVAGYDRLEQLTDADLEAMPPKSRGIDMLDAILCSTGVLDRTPIRGTTRRGRLGQRDTASLMNRSNIPERFRAVTILYLDTYAARVSDRYSTTSAKTIALGHFWRFIVSRYPEVTTSRDLAPAQVRSFVPHALQLARLNQRNPEHGDTTTAHAWLSNVRSFFGDICPWATEPDSPFAEHAPRTIPLTRHDLVGIGFDQARRRTAARMANTVIELEHEMPKIRAHAALAWNDARSTLEARPNDRAAARDETDTFWDWAILELLVQSGLRREEASELTTLDILKRQMPDGRGYYLLHVKPSKYDRARVIPIGDGLGRVIAEMIRHIKRFYGTASVPPCDHWDPIEKRQRPRAPYLLQGHGRPYPIGVGRIRNTLTELSRDAGAQHADGSPLVLRPHDCRRVFATDHLNNHTPVHVIQALLGHANIDTVMVYAKLYPSELVESYRKAMLGVYQARYGEEAARAPTAEEWAAFSSSCSMRDMGTHMCALPAGDHCTKGLVCLGCPHAQPKKSAVPVFRRMLASHERSLLRARTIGESAGQLAARQLEVERLRQALDRAVELNDDAAAAIEAEAIS